MDNAKHQSSTKRTSFRFGSGRILELTDQLINQIPYLIGLTSFAQYSATAFDQDGNLKLDPNIDFNHFRIIIDALPLGSASQLLIRLPKSEDFAAIMLLVDYLGLLPTPHPTLAEIDSMFLFTLENYRQSEMFNYQPMNADLIQRMAAHFAFSLVKDEYDHTDDQVVSQIQWCSMFIVEAYKMFHPSVRWYVKETTRYYFFGRQSCGRSNPVSIKMTKIAKSLLADLDKQSKSNPQSILLSREPKKRHYLHSLSDFDWIYTFHDEFWGWPSSDWWSYSYHEKFVNKVSTRLFDLLIKDFWSKFTHDNGPINPYILRTAPSLQRIRELRKMHDYDMKRVVLQKIFEELLVKTHIRKKVTEDVADHILDLKIGYRHQILDLRYRLERHERGGDGYASFVIRLSGYDFAPERVRKDILLYEKKLEELRQIDRIIDQLCDLVLTKLYELFIESVREMIEVQCDFEDLKEQEISLRKIYDHPFVHVKVVGKSQKHRFHQSLPKLHMRKHQPKKFFHCRF